MTQINYYPDWRKKVTYDPGGPKPAILLADEKVKILMVGLETGQKIPEHPEAASMYYFLEGKGRMLIDGLPYEVGPGTTIIMPAGTVRGLEVDDRLAFLAMRVA